MPRIQICVKLSLTLDVNNKYKYTERVEISFKSKKLSKTCNSDKEMRGRFGKNCAKKLRTRLDDLRAAPTLESFRHLPGRCHELKGDRMGQLSLDLEHPLRLTFLPVGESVKKKADGGLDWNSVTVIEIIDVEDTHD